MWCVIYERGPDVETKAGRHRFNKHFFCPLLNPKLQFGLLMDKVVDVPITPFNYMFPNCCVIMLIQQTFRCPEVSSALNFRISEWIEIRVNWPGCSTIRKKKNKNIDPKKERKNRP